MADDSMALGYALGQDNGGGNDMMGGGAWWILIILFALFNQNGFGGGNRAGEALTRSDLCEGFNFQSVERGIQGIQNGLCDGFYAQNTGMLNGFHGVDNAICNLGYQMQNCCCETNRNIDSVRYDMSRGFCDVVQASHADADRILNYLTQDKIESLRDRAMTAELQLSNIAQTKAIVDQIRPCPIPAYTTCNPWACPSTSGCGY